jgi:predicted ferric reductase
MAIVKKYPAEVVSIKNKVDEIYTVELKSLVAPFKYNPGQFLHLALDEYDPSSHWPESRCFSMQSSPDEENIRITFATKGSYTKKMVKMMEIGSQVTLKLPYGDLFTQEHSKDYTIFIAGGTGITPFLSLFTNSSFKHYRQPHLYFGMRKREMNLYQDELDSAMTINPELSVTFVYEDEHGILNIQRIQEESSSSSYFFISGPPIMITDFKNYLLSNGITKEQIKTDEWE